MHNTTLNTLSKSSHSSTQGRIVARDGGVPSRSATALAFITVIRNLFRPTFVTQNYEETILETRAIGTSVVRVQASDQDGRVRPSRMEPFLNEATGLLALCVVSALFHGVKTYLS